MTVAAPLGQVEMPDDSAVEERPPATGRVILSLARVEGRRLLRHPVFIAGIALSVIMVLIGGDDSVRSTHSVVEPLWPAGFPIGPLAVFGLVGTNLAAVRDRVVGPVVAFFALLLMGASAHPIIAPHFFGLWVVPDSLPSVGWHILYLAGLGISAATLAVLKDGVRRSLVVAAAVGIGAIAAGAILQLPVSCPGASPCVFR